MSAVVSKAKSAAPSGPTGPAEMEAGLPDLVESTTDNHETKMAYDPSSRIPILVVLVWVCAFTSLGIYCASFYFPDLAAWRAP
jgi:hypothetical protein